MRKNTSILSSFLQRLPLLSTTLLLSLLPLFPTTTAAQFDTYEWSIPSFHSEIEIHEDSKITVTEEITADFSRTQRRGIYRVIPIKYRDQFGNKFTTQLKIESVTDKAGNPLTYKTTREGDDINIRIGDEDIFISEEITYKIKYQVQRALLDQPDWDELYWNVNGNGWAVPIQKISATVKLPKSFDTEKLGATCFTGFYGSNSQECIHQITDNQVTYEVTRPFNSFEGLTIGTKFPKGTITHPSSLQKFFWFLQDNWMLSIPFITFFILLRIWWTKGRDPETRDTIVPQYRPPEGLTPTEVGTIIDERVDSHDISAIILDLAIRGFLTIEEKKEKALIFFDTTEYHFKLKKDYNTLITKINKLKPHETETLKAVFGGGFLC